MAVLAPTSSIDGLAWPGLPGGAGTTTLALLYQLQASEWWPAEALVEHQFRQLGVLVRHAARTVPYYTERLGDSSVDLDEALTPEAWARLPILSRQDLQGSFEALCSSRLPKGHGKPHEVTTSGSTGRPVKVLGTAMTGLFARALTVRNHLWHRRDLSQTLAAIRNTGDDGARYPEGERRKNWGRATGEIFATGPSYMLSITTPIEQQIEWLGRRRPAYLSTFPTNLEELARHCTRQGIELAGLRQVQTLGETLAPRVRAACAEAWGVAVADMYSTEEIGYIALQCPEHERYHVQAENAYVEILDDADRPCAPGEVGRVVVTALHNLATPLIRYDLGDYAEAGGACDCGRGLPVLERIMGRTRNMLTLPTGERFWPSLGDAGYTEAAPISQFQLVQTALERIEVRLVALRELEAGEEAALTKLIHQRLGYPFDLEFSYHREIARSEGGKYEDFKSELGS